MRARCARGAAGTPQGSPARKQDQPRRSGQAQTQSRPCCPVRGLSVIVDAVAATRCTVSSPRINSDPASVDQRGSRAEKAINTKRADEGVTCGKLPGRPHEGKPKVRALKVVLVQAFGLTTNGVFIAQPKLHHGVYSRQNLEIVECFWPACGFG